MVTKRDQSDTCNVLKDDTIFIFVVMIHKAIAMGKIPRRLATVLELRS